MEISFYSKELEDKLLAISEIRSKLIHIFDLLEEYGEDAHSIPHIVMEERGLFKIALKGKIKLRLYFCHYKNKLIFLHFYIKKSQKTPKKELEKARKAMREVMG